MKIDPRAAGFLPILVLILGPAAVRGAQEFKLERLKEGPPAEVAQPVKDVLSPECIRVIDPRGKPLADLWLRKEVPPSGVREAKPGFKFPEVAEGTILGAARYHQKNYDFKNKVIPPGVYTLRLAVRPSDGDHLNVSETRDFLILCPAKEDKSLAPIPTAEQTKLSGKASGSKHPLTAWLKPLKEERKEFPALVPDPEKEHQILDLRIPLQGEKEKWVRLGLVIVGTSSEA